MGGKVIPFLKRILFPDGIAGADVMFCQYIWQLFQIADDHDIPRTGECKNAGSKIDLRCFVYDQIIVDVVGAQSSFDGIGRAEHHGIFPCECCGVPAKISHVKTFPAAFPWITSRQFCTEQLQRLLGKFVHFCVERVMLQSAIQFGLLIFKLPLFCGIELVLQIRDDQLRRAKKQPECIEVEPEQDGKLL